MQISAYLFTIGFGLFVFLLYFGLYGSQLMRTETIEKIVKKMAKILLVFWCGTLLYFIFECMTAPRTWESWRITAFIGSCLCLAIWGSVFYIWYYKLNGFINKYSGIVIILSIAAILLFIIISAIIVKHTPQL